MKTLTLTVLMAAFSLLGKADVIYTYSDVFPSGKSIGFTYTAPEYLTNGDRIHIPASAFASCDVSALPDWGCTSAILQGNPGAVSVVLNLVYTPDPHEAFSTDEVNDSFLGATLQAAGSWTAWGNTATFTVTDPPSPKDVAAEAPEPATCGLFALMGALCVLWRWLGARKSPIAQ